MPGVTGLSTLEAAYLEKDNLIIQTIKNVSRDHRFGHSMLCMLSPISSSTSMQPLHDTFRNKFLHSKDYTKEVMSLICQRYLSINHGAAILKDIFVDVRILYPDIIKDVLSSNTLIVDMSKLNAHEDFFSEVGHPGLHIETVDIVMEWSLLHEEKLNSLWRDRHRKTIDRKNDVGDASTVHGTLKLVCLDDIAQIGSKGILRKLLLQKVPDIFSKNSMQ